jgi:hypothetical protein
MWVNAVVRIGLAWVASLLLALLVMEGLHRYLVASGLADVSAPAEATAAQTAEQTIVSADRPR